MLKNQILVLVVTIPAILVILLTGIYFIVNSNTSNVANGMMGGTSSNNGSIAFVLIAIAIIVTFALVLYFVLSKGEKTERVKTNTQINVNSEKSEINISNKYELRGSQADDSKPFDVFLCYKKSSGKDYADHLKAGLEELGLHTFEDCRDIPQTVDTDDGWACVRDKALEESKYFVLIMTHGFELSSEVINEIRMARKLVNKTFVFFRYRSMGRKIVVNLGDEVLDIGAMEQVSFESKEELLRLASNILLKTNT